jgi:hypothetical protein
VWEEIREICFKYCLNDNIETDGFGGACGTHGIMVINYSWLCFCSVAVSFCLWVKKLSRH